MHGICQPQQPCAELQHDNLAAGGGVVFDVLVPLLEQLAVQSGAGALGFSNDLALGERGEHMLGQPPLQDPAERHRDDVVIIQLVKADDLMRDGRPEGGHAAGFDGHALSANEIGQRAPVEEIDLDLVVPIGAGHPPRLPDLAGKAVGSELAAATVEMVQVHEPQYSAKTTRNPGRSKRFLEPY